MNPVSRKNALLSCNVPLLLIVFNRPDLAKLLVDSLRHLEPQRLFVAGDGPRPFIEGENSLVSLTRQVVLESIDWECSVETLFRSENVGLARHIPESIDWVFTSFDRLVLLEDDCIPHPDFLEYCAELLERYRDDSRVWCILGDNSGKFSVPGSASYGFSRYALPVWGIALWKRAWDRHDRNLDLWAELRFTPTVKKLWPKKSERSMMSGILNRVRDVEQHSWAYPWLFSVQVHGGVAIVPKSNLISNVGHQRADASHTKGRSLRANYPTSPILPLIHPSAVRRNYRAEREVRDGRLFGLKKKSSLYRWKQRIKKTLRSWLGT